MSCEGDEMTRAERLKEIEERLKNALKEDR
jgi:hypothetical protein